MAWWNPKSWFQKAPPPPPDPSEIATRWLPAEESDPLPEATEPAIPPEPEPPPIPVLVAPEGAFVWVHADPETPHAGLSSFTNELIPPLSRAFCVSGITPEAANGELMGRVIAWERLTADQLAGFYAPPFGLALHADEFRRILR